ncbi:Smr/MutS family protein [Parasphaerochaeta coccoides]|uniref:Smr protein/MutS2 n=1 Tax=Parasphaerochaeta coccoides (strain ATCC BAA-1237 / DSM 17374 / SPN1) TaxID=760011 RepID=F4GKB1_PARC1|nr:Smr/MutS family protein [Parasphaerochaeta coccoides]AEC02307.1 Smr protein/MutS2 [Parasphaerochaeta coccoides DSM 17374]
MSSHSSEKDGEPDTPDGETYTPFSGLDRSKTSRCQDAPLVKETPSVSRGSAGVRKNQVMANTAESQLPRQVSRQVSPPKGQSIVGGYNPADSFADIFKAWEKTGDPYNSSIQRKQRGKKENQKKPTVVTERETTPSRNFGDILDSWERKAGSIQGSPAFAEKHRDAQEKVGKTEKHRGIQPQGITRSQLRKMPPQAVLDLHGDTAELAAARVRSFLFDARQKGLLKVGVIHGKGLHAADGEGVLHTVVMDEIRRSRMVSEASVPPARHGGSGVLWIIMKN